MVMDYLRSGYRAKMRFWPDRPPVPVVWFPADPEANVFTAETVYRSADWDQPSTNDSFGEQRPYDPAACPPVNRGPWYRGIAPAKYLGLNYCGDLYTWLHGADDLTPEITTDAQGRCPDCAEVNEIAKGGFLLGNVRVCTYNSGSLSAFGPITFRVGVDPNAILSGVVVVMLSCQGELTDLPHLPPEFYPLRAQQWDWVDDIGRPIHISTRVGWVKRVHEHGSWYIEMPGFRVIYNAIAIYIPDAEWAIFGEPDSGQVVVGHPIRQIRAPGVSVEAGLYKAMCFGIYNSNIASFPDFTYTHERVSAAALGFGFFASYASMQDFKGPGNTQDRTQPEWVGSPWVAFQVLVKHPLCWGSWGTVPTSMSGGFRVGGAARFRPDVQVASGGEADGGTARQGAGGGTQLGTGGEADGGTAQQGSGAIQQAAGGEAEGGTATQGYFPVQLAAGGEADGGTAAQSGGTPTQFASGGEADGGTAGQHFGATQLGSGGEADDGTAAFSTAGGSIITTLCPDGLLSVLHLTVSDIAGCACLAGTWTITYDPIASAWIGSQAACGHTVEWRLLEFLGLVWQLLLIVDGALKASGNPDSFICDPPSFYFASIGPLTDPPCDGSVTVTITA